MATPIVSSIPATEATPLWQPVASICPSCGNGEMMLFYQPGSLPAHSVLLLPSRDAALNYPRGDMKLGFCNDCGFVSNLAFNPNLNEYGARYEETQGFSDVFREFHRNVAERLIARHSLTGKTVLEIGCGKGEFLALLCELGAGRGVGFDPAFINGRLETTARDRLTFITDFYSEEYAHVTADFVCCKMTLEHIQETARLVENARRSARGERSVVFFQVPNARYVFRDLAFWDVYYEHCSYFTSGSLGRLFRKCGLRVLRIANEYGDQYLTIEAEPDDGVSVAQPPMEDTVAEIRSDVRRFAALAPARIAEWRRRLVEMVEQSARVVVWGGGSKAVAFLNATQIAHEIEYAVDINPHKWGTFLAGTGQEIVPPEFLKELRPDVILLMNPIYYKEVQSKLESIHVNARIMSV